MDASRGFTLEVQLPVELPNIHYISTYYIIYIHYIKKAEHKKQLMHM